ncbi:nitroreductase family protein [Blautia schinkii]|nr:nitroreductase family protein [Blautia schinkii]
MKPYKVTIDTDKCVGCGICSKVCVAHNIAIKNKKAEILSDNCVMCGQCTAACPKNALSITGYHDKPVEKSGEIRLNPDDVLDVIRFRRSIRQFKQTKIPKEVIAQILEAGRLTHTAKNMQDVSFVVLDKRKDKLEQMAVNIFRRIKPLADIFSPMARSNKIDDHFFFFNAPIAVVILAKDKTNGLLAAQNMEFVAEAHGLGVLYSGFFTMAANASRKMKKAMNVPKGKSVAMTLVLGYPNVKFLRSAPRKKLDVKFM